MTAKKLALLLVVFAFLVWGQSPPPDETHNGWTFHSVLWPGMSITKPDGTTVILQGPGTTGSACNASGECLVDVFFTDRTPATLRVHLYNSKPPEWVVGELSQTYLVVADNGTALMRLQTTKPDGIYAVGPNNDISPVLKTNDVLKIGTVGGFVWYAFTPDNGIVVGVWLSPGLPAVIYRPAGATEFQLLQTYQKGQPFLVAAFNQVTPKGMYGFFQNPYTSDPTYMPGVMGYDGSVSLTEPTTTFPLNPTDGNTYALGITIPTGNGIGRGVSPFATGASDQDGMTSLGAMATGPVAGQYDILNCISGKGCRIVVPNPVPGFPGSSTLTEQTTVSTSNNTPGQFAFTAEELQPSLPYPNGSSGGYTRNIYVADFKGNFTPVIRYNDFSLFENDKDIFRTARYANLVSANSVLFNYEVFGQIAGIKQMVSYLTLATKGTLTVANAASFNPSQPLAPGTTLFSLFSTVPLGNPEQAPAAPSWPTTLGGTTVTFCGISAPLMGNYGFVNGSLQWQINGQVPSGIAGQTSCPVVASDGVHTLTTTVAVSQDPKETFSLFQVPVTDNKGVAALDPIITNQKWQFILPAGDVIANLGSNLITQAKPGDWVTLWGTGCGNVAPVVPDGYPAPTTTLSYGAVSVTVAGQPATVQFSGLAPLFIGLCQVNVQVPSGTPNGLQPLTFGSPGQVSFSQYMLPVANR